MVLLDYTLADIRTHALEEFGITSNTVNDAIVDRRINQALFWLVQRRPNWPWLNLQFVYDIPQPTSTTGDFTQDSRTVLNVPVALTQRAIVTTQASGTRPSTGFLVVQFSGTTLTLDEQYLGAAVVALPLRQVSGIFQLPNDFIRLDEKPILGNDLANPRLTFKTPTEFDAIRRANLNLTLRDSFYTVTQDPLDSIDNKYLWVYPYLAQRDVLRIRYWQDPPKLVANGDIPVVPRIDRPVLLSAAMWYIAQWQKDVELVAFYKAEALEGLERMTQEYELTDDLEDARDSGDPGWIIPPSGYGMFDESV